MAAVKKPERTQRERREMTTHALIAAARSHFAAGGYALTSLDDIAADAGVSKGALYHHFPGGKGALFREVYEHEQRRIAAKTAAAYLRETDPLKGLYAGFRAFFQEIFDPGTGRISLIDGPAVLGVDDYHEIEERYAIDQMKEALRRAIDEGIIARRNLDPLAHMLFGAVCQAATMTARAEDARTTGRQALKELRTLVESLRRTPQ